MYVVLFDIDGTLILTDRAGQHALEETMSASGLPRHVGDVDYAGRTDRSIVADHLRRCGLEDTQENFERYAEAFLARLPTSLAARNGRVLPGVIESLKRLRQRDNVRLGLLTGNLRKAARMKLAHFGLVPYFYVEGEPLGGFGDDHHHRDDVARQALVDLRARVDERLEPHQIWIVGDTPRDVQCARAIGARVLAVATGGYSVDELRQTEPDLVAADLTSADPWWPHFA